MKQCRTLTLALLCVSAFVLIVGCPGGTPLPPQQFVIGGVGDTDEHVVLLAFVDCITFKDAHRVRYSLDMGCLTFAFVKRTT